MMIGGIQGPSSGWRTALQVWTSPGAPRTPDPAPRLVAAKTPTAARSSLLTTVRGLLRGAAEGLRAAFTSFKTTLTPIVNRITSTTTTAAAKASGTAARLTPIAGTASTMQSGAPLGLDVTERASTLQSTAEMNSSATSLSAYELTFAASTGRAQLSGSYRGPAAALHVQIVSAASVGKKAEQVSFKVTDEQGVDVASFSGKVTADEVVDIGDTGLTVRFTSGSLSAGTTASVTVSATPTTVDAGAAFDAAYASAPRFEDYRQVTSGSFKINGTSITVRTDDSIDSVVADINGSKAGVTAAVVGDRITLTRTDASEDAIVLGNDTSGFLAATKLADASTDVGNIRDDRQALAALEPFAGVTAGSFSINAAHISVDPKKDTLETLLARISASGAGVTASYDDAAQTVTLTSTTTGDDPIVLGDDTSGVLAALSLDGAAIVTRGTASLHAFDAPLARSPEYTGVTSGTISVNGHEVVVDPSRMSLRDVVSSLDRVPGVTAALDEHSGRITLTADRKGKGLAIGDSSGLLATLGIATGVHQDTTETATTEQVTGVTRTTNTSAVAASAGAAVDTLVAAVSKLGKDPSRTPEFRRDLEEAMFELVDSLRHAGVQGLSMVDTDGQVGLAVDEGRLEESLERLGNREDAGRAVETLVDGFAGRIAEVSARRRAHTATVTLAQVSLPAWQRPSSSGAMGVRRPDIS